ncbi:uncharacterized protein LOC109705937 [Ananas comosus]|uniref:Uncharacterized protein LOC109705937 n=1 Tax=Ananas comosus TaxID=4615 RepID=A0A6P5ELV8_ANACO|nr:uncharacterized protein LOC109705937 [Ananas comosus]
MGSVPSFSAHHPQPGGSWVRHFPPTRVADCPHPPDRSFTLPRYARTPIRLRLLRQAGYPSEPTPHQSRLRPLPPRQPGYPRLLCISRSFARSLRGASPGSPPPSTGSPHQASLRLSCCRLYSLFKLRDCRMAGAPEVQNWAGRTMMPSVQARGPPPTARPRVEPVDREKTCPLLLRVFTKIGGHHPNEDFAVRGKEPKDEVQIYTWKDATLRELTDLVKEVAPAARKRDAKLSFAFVYPDKNGRFVVRPVGMTFSYGNGRLDDGKTLAELGFQIGDYLSVAIL